LPEAFLALEAQIGYCTIAVATDYDCWLDDPAQQVLAQFRASLEQVQQLLPASVAHYEEDETRPCRSALRGALVTPREQMTPEQQTLVELLLR
jgi:5'-methylthioadenosine phosphorylase